VSRVSVVIRVIRVGRVSRVIRVSRVLAVALLMAMPAAAQVRPPVLTTVTPYGLQRGTTVTLTLEGANIANTDQVVFDVPGLTASVGEYKDLGADVRKRMPGETGAIIQDKAQKASLTIAVTATADVPIGRHGLRLHTPLGTTSLMPVWVGAEPEQTETEPNDDASQANEVTAPVTVNAALGKEGDVDTYRVMARAGHDLVVGIVAAPLGSMTDTTVSVLSSDGHLLASNDDFRDSKDSLVIYRPPADGPLLVRVADRNAAGGWRQFYRVSIGELPVLTSVFPLGRSEAAKRAVNVEGANLGGQTSGALGATSSERPHVVPVLLPGLNREPINRISVALGKYPELMEHEGNDTLATAQPLTVPVTVNGRINHDGKADADLFRIQARKGEPLVVQVAADRLGSSLDSVLEILDAAGKPVPRARLRPVWETTVDLRNHGSTGSGIRLLAWNELHRGDYVYIDRELLQVLELPKGPDEDTFFQQYRGQRISYEDTTAEGHALLRPVYKVQVLAPGTPVAPNGLPVFDLVYRNDDGGPTYGQDSYLTFQPPATGTYFIRLTDARGTSGPRHAYRLTVAPPAPDYELFVSPSNPNVPRGGRVPLTIFALRHDGFDGPIEVSLKDLPPGVTATTGTVLPGENSVSVTLDAADTASASMAALELVGHATINGRPVEHRGRPDEQVSVISVAMPPDVRVVSVTPTVVELPPGGRAKVTATIARANGFAGRVPLSVENLPFRVTVPNIGLNGILITEEQDSRTFDIVADDNAQPVEQTLYVTARVETNGGTTSEHSSTPITIRIVGRSATPVAQGFSPVQR
jgi:hypothetical protein